MRLSSPRLPQRHWAIVTAAVIVSVLVYLTATRHEQYPAKRATKIARRTPVANTIANLLLAKHRPEHVLQGSTQAAGASAHAIDVSSSIKAASDLVSVSRQQADQVSHATGLAIPHIVWQTVRSHAQPPKASLAVKGACQRTQPPFARSTLLTCTKDRPSSCTDSVRAGSHRSLPPPQGLRM